MPMMFWEKAEERGRDSWVQRNGWPHWPTKGWHALLRIIEIRWAKSSPLGRSFIPHVRYRTGRTVTSITWIFLKDANVCSVLWSAHSLWLWSCFPAPTCVLARSVLILAILCQWLVPSEPKSQRERWQSRTRCQGSAKLLRGRIFYLDNKGRVELSLEEHRWKVACLEG